MPISLQKRIGGHRRLCMVTCRNTMAFVRSALGDPALVDQAYGAILLSISIQ